MVWFGVQWSHRVLWLEFVFSFGIVGPYFVATFTRGLDYISNLFLWSLLLQWFFINLTFFLTCNSLFSFHFLFFLIVFKFLFVLGYFLGHHCHLLITHFWAVRSSIVILWQPWLFLEKVFHWFSWNIILIVSLIFLRRDNKKLKPIPTIIFWFNYIFLPIFGFNNY